MGFTFQNNHNISMLVFFAIDNIRRFSQSFYNIHKLN